MPIFANTTLRQTFCAIACVALCELQVSYGQNITAQSEAGKGGAETTEIRPGQTHADAVDDHPQPLPAGNASAMRRPMLTGSSLLPAPVNFTRGSVDPVRSPEAAVLAPDRTYDPRNPSPARPTMASESDLQAEQEVVRLTNEVRASAGLPPLAWNEDLANAARHHAADMEADGYFDHDTYDRINGQLVRICSAQERMGLFSPVAAGENIAHGQRTPDEVMQTWLASPPHRRGILRPGISTIGVGKVGKNWVQNFGW